jgi:hypothetical protein
MEVIDLRRVLHLQRSNLLLDKGKRHIIRDTSKRTTPKTQPTTKHTFDAQTLETLWLQQDEDLQEFICSLQQMKNKINKIRVNQMVQMDILKFFNHS